MNQEVLLQMMRATIPRDKPCLRHFYITKQSILMRSGIVLFVSFYPIGKQTSALFRYFTLRQMFQLLSRLVLMIMLMIY